MLVGEVALCTSSLKRLSEKAARNPDDLQDQVDFSKRLNTLRMLNIASWRA